MEFTLKATFTTTPSELYNAWLNGELHEQMTGGGATCSNEIGGEFSAWGGYIWGKNLALTPNKKIVQTWRTTEFADDEKDSKIEVTLETVPEGTKLTLVHTNLPAHGEQYINGWKEHYFVPMTAFFN